MPVFTPPTAYLSKANTGYEATLSVGSPLAPLIELVSFSGQLAESQPVKKTHLLSPAYTHELFQGMINPGVFDITGNFIGDPTQTGILTDMQAQSQLNFQILASMQNGAKTLTVAGIGYFSNLELGPFENDKTIDFKAKFQTTGSSTIVVA
jgi:hypothetical protein